MDQEYFADRIVDNANVNYLGPLGGTINGVSAKNFRDLDPNVMFEIELNKWREFLENYIDTEDYDYVRNATNSFNQKLFKNPALILLSFIVCKLSLNTEDDISINVMKTIMSKPEMLPLIQENRITRYDVFRYCRFFMLHLNIKSNYKK